MWFWRHDSSPQDLAAAVTERQTTDIPASTNPSRSPQLRALAAFYQARDTQDPEGFLAAAAKGFSPPPPPNSVFKASPNHRTAPLDAAGLGMTAVTVGPSTTLQSSTEPDPGSGLGPSSPAASSTAASAPRSRSHRHRLHHQDTLALVPWGWRVRRALDLRRWMMDDSIEYNSRDLAYIVEQLGMRPLDPDDCVHGTRWRGLGGGVGGGAPGVLLLQDRL